MISTVNSTFATKTSLFVFLTVLIIGCSFNNKIISPVKIDGKYGFIDKNGDWFIRPVFDSVDIFYKGFANSYNKGKTGVINKKGHQIIGYDFDFIGHFHNNIALVVIGDSINYVKTNGKAVSSSPFFDGKDFFNGLAPIQPSHKGKWGYINTKGKLVIDTIFDYAGEFKDGKALVNIKGKEFFINKKGVKINAFVKEKEYPEFRLIGNSNLNNLGMLNSKGDTIMPMKFVSFGYRQGDLFRFNDGVAYGLVDTMGRSISTRRFQYLSYFSNNGLALAKENGFFGFIDKKGRTSIAFQFEEASGFKHGLAAVKINGKWGFIDEQGNFKIEPQFEAVGFQFRPLFAKYESMYDFEE